MVIHQRDNGVAPSEASPNMDIWGHSNGRPTALLKKSPSKSGQELTEANGPHLPAETTDPDQPGKKGRV